MAIKPKKVRLTWRERKKRRLRKRLVGTDARPRLCVFKSGRNTYAQLISDESGVTIAAASTLEEAVRAAAGEAPAEDAPERSKSPKSVAAAKAVGTLIAQRAVEKGCKSVVFDRNGYIYHGRISAVADGARQSGLVF